jgi:hypothetical protein
MRSWRLALRAPLPTSSRLCVLGLASPRRMSGETLGSVWLATGPTGTWRSKWWNYFSAGFSVRSADRVRRNALHIACAWSSAEIVEVLLEADPGALTASVATSDRDSPLMCCCAREDQNDVIASQIATLLLDLRSDVNATGRYGCTPLLKAAASGGPALVGLLLARGADVHAKDEFGHGALRRACGNGLHGRDVVPTLCKAGADVEVRGAYNHDKPFFHGWPRAAQLSKHWLRFCRIFLMRPSRSCLRTTRSEAWFGAQSAVVEGLGGASVRWDPSIQVRSCRAGPTCATGGDCASTSLKVTSSEHCKARRVCRCGNGRRASYRTSIL